MNFGAKFLPGRGQSVDVQPRLRWPLPGRERASFLERAYWTPGPEWTGLDEIDATPSWKELVADVYNKL